MYSKMSNGATRCAPNVTKHTPTGGGGAIAGDAVS